jgi:hypothetical protein
MNDPVRDFYDVLAPGYHRIFADWRASIRRQAGVLGALVERTLDPAGSGFYQPILTARSRH